MAFFVPGLSAGKRAYAQAEKKNFLKTFDQNSCAAQPSVRKLVFDVMTWTWGETSASGKPIGFSRLRQEDAESVASNLLKLKLRFFFFLAFLNGYLRRSPIALSPILHVNVYALTLQKYFLFACFGTLSLVYISPCRGPKRVPSGMYSLLNTPVTWKQKGTNHYS